MRTSQLYLLLAAVVFGLCRADFLDYASQIPSCGLSCLLELIPESACQSVTNSTCICTDNSLFAAVDDCMSANCTVLDRLTVAKIDEEACNKAQERRAGDIPGFIVLDVISTICLIVKLCVRYQIASKWEVDDWVTFVVLIFFLLFFVDELFYTATLALSRVGLLFFLIRIFAVPTFRRICWGVMAWVCLTCVLIIFLTIFQCTPVSYNWEGWTGEIQNYKCIDINALAYAAASIGIAQDVAILVLPLPIIAGLNMPLKKRLMTLFMFSLGIVVVITSAFRLRYLVQFSASLNPTWDYTDAVIWTSLEVNVTVIVLCLPTIKVLFARLLPSIFGSTAGTRRTNATHPSRVQTTSTATPRRNKYEDISDAASSGSQAPVRRHWDSDMELGPTLGPTYSDGESDKDKEFLQLGPKTYVSAGISSQRGWKG
ncbi:hypothetical protein BX600DRAFT_527222 [Xylariales sp. PMI_506]|nr:hypothetical protein BX600DRAFT_527222 [Xylariales sp. PMI_506]